MQKQQGEKENTANTGGRPDGASASRTLLDSPEYRFVNEQYHLRSTASAVAEGGFFVKLRTAIRRRLANSLRSLLLDDYFEREQEFHGNLVRLLNTLCRLNDTTAWRMDDQTRAALHQLRVELQQEQGKEAASLRENLTELATRQRLLDEQLATMDSVVRGVERIIARYFGSVDAKATTSHASGAGEEIPDQRYVLLENRFRGSEEAVAAQLSDIVPLFKDVSQTVVEIGAGRGELQEQLRAAGISSYGVELDQAMVDRCLDKGLDVRCEDGIRHLEGLSQQTLSGIIAIQVVEHLPLEQLKRFLTLAASRLADDGRLVVETINTESMVALAQNYFRDPTHVWPLHPDTMRHLFEMAGLEVVALERRSPFPKAAILQPIAADAAMPPRWREAIAGVNDTVRRLNDLLFGYQDYRIIGRVGQSNYNANKA